MQEICHWSYLVAILVEELTSVVVEEEVEVVAVVEIQSLEETLTLLPQLLRLLVWSVHAAPIV